MARCPSVSFPLEAAAISPQPCSLCFSCSPWTFRSIPCAHQHSLAVLQAEVRCSPPPPAAVWGCTAGWDPPGSPRCPQPCPHSPAVPVLLAVKGPHLDLLPKQFVAGGCCLLSVAAAMLLGSRPGTWDPERLKEKGVKETITVPPSSTLSSLPPERRPRSTIYYRTEQPACYSAGRCQLCHGDTAALETPTQGSSPLQVPAQHLYTSQHPISQVVSEQSSTSGPWLLPHGSLHKSSPLPPPHRGTARPTQHPQP